jgi:hypothetical protein
MNAQIFRDDGTLHPGHFGNGHYCCTDRPIQHQHPNAPKIGDRYIQIGKWRFGDIDSSHASVSINGRYGVKTAQVYTKDGSLLPGPHFRYNCFTPNQCDTSHGRECVIKKPDSKQSNCAKTCGYCDKVKPFTDLRAEAVCESTKDRHLIERQDRKELDQEKQHAAIAEEDKKQQEAAQAAAVEAEKLRVRNEEQAKAAEKQRKLDLCNTKKGKKQYGQDSNDPYPGCNSCKLGLTSKGGSCQFIEEHHQKIGHPCNEDNNCKSDWCLNNGGKKNAKNGAKCGCRDQGHMDKGSPDWGGTYTCTKCRPGLTHVRGKCRRNVGGHCSNGNDDQCANGKYGKGWCVRAESKCV